MSKTKTEKTIKVPSSDNSDSSELNGQNRSYSTINYTAERSDPRRHPIGQYSIMTTTDAKARLRKAFPSESPNRGIAWILGNRSLQATQTNEYRVNNANIELAMNALNSHSYALNSHSNYEST